MRRGHLLAVGLALELRAPHGPKEGWHRQALRRLLTSEQSDFRGCLSHPTYPRIHVVPRGEQDLLKSGFGRRLSPDPVSSEHIPKTAISTPFSLFEFVRMPFGLKNAAQTFQRLMDSVTSKLSGVFVYLDDVLVASPTAKQQERNLRQLFAALAHFGLVLNVNKCVFGVRELQFLGHTVSEQDIRPLPDKVESVRQFERPRSVKALQRFLSMVNFYRRFLPGIAGVMRPLTDALAGVSRQLTWDDGMMSAFHQTKEPLQRQLFFSTQWPTPS